MTLVPLLLDGGQVAELLNVSPQTVVRLEKAGEISSVLVRRSRRYLRADVEAYVERLADGKRSKP